VKRLTITYDDVTLVDVDVEEFGWQDTDGQVAVTGKWRPVKPSAAAGSGLLDLISSASRQRTQSMADRKRSERDAEQTVIEEAADD